NFFGNGMDDDFFDKFFGVPKGDIKQKSLGTGFIIEDGYILTNYHVIKDAEEIKVVLDNGNEFDAEVIGKDAKLDIGVIKIKSPKDLPFVQLGDSDVLEVGEWVVAIGNPFGFKHTVTAGILSGKERTIGTGPYDQYLQTDASINPGNSGGPLFNAKGEVVGINTAIIAGGQGIGFAIPINAAKDVLPDLKKEGRVIRGWLGLIIQKVTPSLAQSLGMEKDRGALVAEVVKDSPADKSGIKEGDIITKFNGKNIEEYDELTRFAAKARPGTEVEVIFIREGKEKKLKIKLGEYPEDEQSGEDTEKTKVELGMELRDITPEIARKLGFKETDGVLVVEITPNSPADKAEMRQGDVISEVNRKKVKDINDYRKYIKELKEGDVALLRIKRGNHSHYAAIELEKKKRR
ncbi:MAG: trypsin-like peptidase domain-containing protein, partial [bacterium]